MTVSFVRNNSYGEVCKTRSCSRENLLFFISAKILVFLFLSLLSLSLSLSLFREAGTCNSTYLRSCSRGAQNASRRLCLIPFHV